MRLLNVNTLQLTEFYGSSIPPYAILSHTWEAGEALFDDLVSLPKGIEVTKPGFKKVAAAAAQALHDGFEYVWVDTCCIDKKSSAELSEAINSMFEWYQKSSVCYAYLSDIDSKADIEDPEDRSRLSQARWFTRGWTLQELLAPRHVQFFDRNWVYIGTKQCLSAQLSTITLIDISYLKGKDLSTASIAQRMSWASNRVTTRQEDLAYCLLGLFGINMPLLYGEGRKAFRRLQEEILRSSSDESIFCWWRADLSSTAKSRNPQRGDKHEPRGLLAETPHDFTHSASIISWPEVSQSFENNNIGIRLKLPNRSSLVSRGSLQHVKLQCRDLNHPADYIYIPIGFIPQLAAYTRVGSAKPINGRQPANSSLNYWLLNLWSGNLRRHIISTLLLLKDAPVIPQTYSRPESDVHVQILSSMVDNDLSLVNVRSHGAIYDSKWRSVRRATLEEGFVARMLFRDAFEYEFALYIRCRRLAGVRCPQIGDCHRLPLDLVYLAPIDRIAETDDAFLCPGNSLLPIEPSILHVLYRRNWKTKLDLEFSRILVQVRSSQGSALRSGYTVTILKAPRPVKYTASTAIYLSLLCFFIFLGFLPHLRGWKRSLGHVTKVDPGYAIEAGILGGWKQSLGPVTEFDSGYAIDDIYNGNRFQNNIN